MQELVSVKAAEQSQAQVELRELSEIRTSMLEDSPETHGDHSTNKQTTNAKDLESPASSNNPPGKKTSPSIRVEQGLLVTLKQLASNNGDDSHDDEGDSTNLASLFEAAANHIAGLQNANASKSEKVSTGNGPDLFLL